VLENIKFWKPPFYLNIRQKVAIGLTLCLLAIGFVGGTSYRYLIEIERKQHFVEIADDLSNTILEIRRYEKNFLLYRSVEDLEENRKYIAYGLTVLNSIANEMKHLKGAPQFNLIEKKLLAYKGVMEQIAECIRLKQQLCGEETESRLREYGKELVDRANGLVKFEREQILIILKTLESYLLSSLLIFLTMGFFLITIVARKIISPLKIIEETTRHIAQGNFKSLPVVQTHDETQKVVEAFNRMVEELEKRQEQLLQARKLSSIGILTSGIAHQLNNPLNNISTSCQILLEEGSKADTEFVHKMLTNIEQEVHRARDTVKGLLEFSREKEFALKPTPLSEVVERSIRLISSQVPSGIRIEQNIPKSLILNLDAQKMQEVFLNLMMNAIQAIRTLPGHIRISASADENFGIITVEDSGGGIPEKIFSHIFDPFFTTKDVGAGTGLGLSIAYGIIQKHHGTISVESRVQEGTKFIIRLPLYLTDK
jgi:signal transduction histidine kinase